MVILQSDGAHCQVFFFKIGALPLDELLDRFFQICGGYAGLQFEVSGVNDVVPIVHIPIEKVPCGGERDKEAIRVGGAKQIGDGVFRNFGQYPGNHELMIAARKILDAEGLTKYIGFAKIFECLFCGDHHGKWCLQGTVWVTMQEPKTKHGEQGAVPNLDIFPKHLVALRNARLDAIPTVIIGHQLGINFLQTFAQRARTSDVHADVGVFPDAGQEILAVRMAQLLVYLQLAPDMGANEQGKQDTCPQSEYV